MAVRGQVSVQAFDTRWDYGPFDLDHRERNAQLNVEALWPIHLRWELAFGASHRHRDTEIIGTTGADSTDFREDAATATRQTRARTDSPGAYLESTLNVWGPLYATLGARVDHASRPGIWTADPRAALAWRADEHQTLRVAAGNYHQLADPSYLDPIHGNPDLAPSRATHAIGGYEWKSEYVNFRLEAYRKDYRDLVTHHPGTYYANAGHGFARGVDAFLQGSVRWLSGWVSYGYLDSRRKELDDSREGPSVHGVRHSVTLVAQYQATSSLQLGAKYNATTGRPFTPVVGASYDASADFWRPIYGDHHSERMPAYHRLDVRFTQLFSVPAFARVPESSVCVFYVEAMNVLGLRNVLEFVYNQDYSARRTIDSYFSRRMLVVGAALTW
jgi:outer membrane receptor for ferrienterochelin and colicin